MNAATSATDMSSFTCSARRATVGTSARSTSGAHILRRRPRSETGRSISGPIGWYAVGIKSVRSGRRGPNTRTGQQLLRRAGAALVELDRVAVGILDLDLRASRTLFDRIAEARSGGLHLLNLRIETRDIDDDAVPPARLLPAAVRHRPRAGAAGAAQDELQRATRDHRECGAGLVFELEVEDLGVELD